MTVGLTKKKKKSIIILFPTYKTTACICCFSRNVFGRDKLKRQERKDFREKLSLGQDPPIAEEGQRSFWAHMSSLGLGRLKTAWFSRVQQNQGSGPGKCDAERPLYPGRIVNDIPSTCIFFSCQKQAVS